MFTLTAIGSAVHIFSGVTAATGAGYAQFFGHGLLVTLITAQFAMRTIQLEAGFIMVKIPGRPAAHVMAGVTCRTQAPLVYVLFLMAGPAIRFGVLESRGGVTLFAIH